MNRVFPSIALTTIICFFLPFCNPKTEYKTLQFEDLSPYGARKLEKALVGMSTAQGLAIQLFAGEPLITNPTNIDVDDRGRVWVAESYNYDVSPEKEDKKGDRIVILEDTNGDGKADTRKVFYQGTDINVPLGILVAGNKVYVTRSPNLLVFTDENGDDIPDRKDTLFTGMGEKGDHGAHTALMGPDGKLYFSIGNYGKQVLDKLGQPITDKAGNIVNTQGKPYRNGQIFRCHPDGSNFEVVAHNFRNSYEPAIDSYGNIWATDNDDDGNQACRVNFVMEYGNYGYFDEITGASWTAHRTNMEHEIPQRHWHQNDPGVIPNLLVTGAGSPAGLTFYEGTMLPDSLRNCMIHTEPLFNTVRAYPTTKKGAGFEASVININQGKDQWYRPVDVAVAPDGSLIVADWYDPGVGGGTAADADKGRIYRIHARKTSYKIQAPNYRTPAACAEALKSSNHATRYKAFLRLKDFGLDAEKDLLQLWNSDNPVYQARALWLLVALKEKAHLYIAEALKNENPDLRIVAIRALRQTQFPIVEFLKTVARDPDPQVRREAAIALRYCNEPGSHELWAALANQYPQGDRWYLEALGIGSDLYANERFTAWLTTINPDSLRGIEADIIWRSRAEKAIPLLQQIILEQRTTIIVGWFFRAFDFHTSDAKNQALINILNANHPLKNAFTLLALQHLDANKYSSSHPAVKNALNLALKNTYDTQEYVSLVERYKVYGEKQNLIQLAAREGDSELGQAAAQLLLNFGFEADLLKAVTNNRPAMAQNLLLALKGNGYAQAMNISKAVIFNPNQNIETQKTAVKVLGSSWMGESELLECVKRKDFPQQLKATAGSVLFGVYRTSIHREAEKYLPKPAAKGGKPLPPIHLLVNEGGDAAKGKAVFIKNCTQCHKAENQGVKFGPELSQIGSKLSKEGFYKAILYPDEGISHGYEGYTVFLNDGSIVVGVKDSETQSELNLVQQGGKTIKIPKNKVQKVEKNTQSLMPNFSTALTQADLADLVSYLQTLK